MCALVNVPDFIRTLGNIEMHAGKYSPRITTVLLIGLRVDSYYVVYALLDSLRKCHRHVVCLFIRDLSSARVVVSPP